MNSQTCSTCVKAHPGLTPELSCRIRSVWRLPKSGSSWTKESSDPDSNRFPFPRNCASVPFATSRTEDGTGDAYRDFAGLALLAEEGDEDVGVRPRAPLLASSSASRESKRPCVNAIRLPPVLVVMQ